jgi:NDP-sugar pyrophosphorylase family protein
MGDTKIQVVTTLLAKHCLRHVDVLVLAGGLGTRIRPILAETPKLLAPIAGRTYLDNLLDWLAHFGARRVVLALGFRAEAIDEHLARYRPRTMTVETVVEPQPLGTAGAIRGARLRLRTDPVLIVNGDSFVDVDLCRFRKHHRSVGAVATILCAAVADAGRYGRVQLDDRGAILNFIEKETAFRGVALVSAGMYFLSTALLDTITSGTATSLEKDVFERLPPGSLAAFAECGNFIDIGTPESLAMADKVFALRMSRQPNGSSK